MCEQDFVRGFCVEIYSQSQFFRVETDIAKNRSPSYANMQRVCS